MIQSNIEIIPLFRLPLSVVPGEIFPLFIFEPRYQRMVSHCVENKKEFGITFTEKGNKSDFGCMVRIESVIETDQDGGSIIICVATRPYMLLNQLPEDNYPKAQVMPLIEEKVAVPSELYRQAKELLDYLIIREYSEHESRIAASQPHLSFTIAALFDFDPQEKILLLSQTSESARLQTALQCLRFKTERINGKKQSPFEKGRDFIH